MNSEKILKGSLEHELRELIEANSKANRAKWALQAKKEGKKVIGLLCSYVPEEVVLACGMLPWRVTGSWRENVPLASVYRPTTSCPFCNHVLEALLSGELDFLDGVVATSRDQDLVRLLDVWATLGKTPFTFQMYLPHQDSELACRQLAKEMRKLLRALEDFGGTAVSKGALVRATEVCNQTRSLLLKLYELRKRDVPPLSGAEFLGMTTAAAVMPKEEFNWRLEALLPYLEERRTSLTTLHPRILVSSDMLDNPAYLELIEELGCLVAMDDLDTGSRYFWQLIETGATDPLQALAQRYLLRPGSPHLYSWRKQVAQVIEWVRDFAIDGVIELPLIYSQARQIRVPFFRDKLKEAGIPSISLRREYHLANVGQLKTRVQAFLEMLG